MLEAYSPLTQGRRLNDRTLVKVHLLSHILFMLEIVRMMLLNRTQSRLDFDTEFMLGMLLSTSTVH